MSRLVLLLCAYLAVARGQFSSECLFKSCVKVGTFGDYKVDERNYDFMAYTFGVGSGIENRGALPRSIGLWPRVGTLVPIPYTISSNITDATRLNGIAAAIAEYHAKTCIRFINRTTETDYIEFIDGVGCASYVGRVGGKQTIDLEDGCGEVGIVIHEIMHALGFAHEQARRDRDDHVIVNFQNINASDHNEFIKIVNWDNFTSPYDKLSIMQYASFAFSNNSNPTITNLDGSNLVTQDLALSIQDVFLIAARYCPSTLVPDCKDKREECATWNAFGFCSQFPDSMYIFCQSTCNQCTPVAPGTCYDKHRKCAWWAGEGYCNQTYVSFMTKYCKKSCDFCETVVQPPICVDSRPQLCPIWQSEGYCANQLFQRAMEENCQVSCGICQPSTVM